MFIIATIVAILDLLTIGYIVYLLIKKRKERKEREAERELRQSLQERASHWGDFDPYTRSFTLQGPTITTSATEGSIYYRQYDDAEGSIITESDGIVRAETTPIEPVQKKEDTKEVERLRKIVDII